MALSTLLASLLCQGVRTRQFLAIADDTSDGRLAQRVRPYTLFFSKRRRSKGLLPAAFVSSDTSQCHPTSVLGETQLIRSNGWCNHLAVNRPIEGLEPGPTRHRESRTGDPVQPKHVYVTPDFRMPIRLACGDRLH